MVELNNKYGNTREAIIGFGSYGLILAGILNSPEIGYIAGKQALKLLEKYQADDLIAQAGFVDSTFIAHWKEPVHEMGAKCHHYYRQGMSNGDIWYSGWNLYMGNVFRIYVGEKMSELIDSLYGQETFFQQHNLTNLWQRTQFELYFAKKIRHTEDTGKNFDWEKISRFLWIRWTLPSFYGALFTHHLQPVHRRLSQVLGYVSARRKVL
jgi:predicted ATPase